MLKCPWCGNEVPLDEFGKMIYHEDIYPVRACQGSGQYLKVEQTGLVVSFEGETTKTIKEKMAFIGTIVEEAIRGVFDSKERPVFVLAVQLPIDPFKYEYVSSAARMDGIKLLRETAASMEKGVN